MALGTPRAYWLDVQSSVWAPPMLLPAPPISSNVKLTGPLPEPHSVSCGAAPVQVREVSTTIWSVDDQTALGRPTWRTNPWAVAWPLTGTGASLGLGASPQA